MSIEEINKYLTDNEVTIVKNLEEVEFRHSAFDLEGFKLVTTQGDILFGISSFQRCCEEWGYESFIENKSAEEDFVGARVLAISDTCDALESRGDSTEPLIIKTDKGDIDLWVYNEHNGYYSHSSVIKVFGSLVSYSSL